MPLHFEEVGIPQRVGDRAARVWVGEGVTGRSLACPGGVAGGCCRASWMLPHRILLRVALWRNWTDALPLVLAAQCQGERRRLEEEGVIAYPFSVWWCLTGCGSPSSDEEEVAAGGKAAAEEEGEAAGGVEGGI